MADEAERSAILARIGAWTLAGELPPTPVAIAERLVAEGFAEGAVRAAVGAELPPRSQRPPEVVQLSDEANRFLDALRDLGYLDDAMEEEVLDSLIDEGTGTVGLVELRRHVAMVLFDRQHELDVEMLRHIQEEWRLVFH